MYGMMGGYGGSPWGGMQQPWGGQMQSPWGGNQMMQNQMQSPWGNQMQSPWRGQQNQGMYGGQQNQRYGQQNQMQPMQRYGQQGGQMQNNAWNQRQRGNTAGGLLGRTGGNMGAQNPNQMNGMRLGGNMQPGGQTPVGAPTPQAPGGMTMHPGGNMSGAMMQNQPGRTGGETNGQMNSNTNMQPGNTVSSHGGMNMQQGNGMRTQPGMRFGGGGMSTQPYSGGAQMAENPMMANLRGGFRPY